MIIYEVIQYVLIALGGGLLGYQMLLSFLALKGKEISDFGTERQRKFVIVIPAHNEEKVIAKTLYSLFGLVYPKNLYQLVVVADNCTDNTARIARKLGAKVLERTHKYKRGKGFALRWAFDQILDWEENYEGIIVLDSDSLISGNYLEVMNYYLEKGSKVIQSSDLVLPQPGVWSSESIRIGFLLYNYVKPMGRKLLGFDMGLRGNGMCFSPEVLRKHPWQAWSLTEDVEYGLSLLLEGYNIDFAPEATLWAQMPVKAKNAESQRTRWEMGRYPIIKKYVPKLVKSFFKKRSFRFLDTFVDLITPPLVNLLLLVLVMIGLNLVLWLGGFIPVTFTLIWLSIALMGILHLFVGLFAAGADKQMYKSIFYIPVYVFWKMKIYFTTWLKGQERQWIRTTRDAGKLKH